MEYEGTQMTKIEAITRIEIAKDIITKVELAIGHYSVEGIPFNDFYINTLMDAENCLARWINGAEDEQ